MAHQLVGFEPFAERFFLFSSAPLRSSTVTVTLSCNVRATCMAAVMRYPTDPSRKSTRAMLMFETM